MRGKLIFGAENIAVDYDHFVYQVVFTGDTTAFIYGDNSVLAADNRFFFIGFFDGILCRRGNALTVYFKDFSIAVVCQAVCIKLHQLVSFHITAKIPLRWHGVLIFTDNDFLAADSLTGNHLVIADLSFFIRQGFHLLNFKAAPFDAALFIYFFRLPRIFIKTIPPIMNTTRAMRIAVFISFPPYFLPIYQSSYILPERVILLMTSLQLSIPIGVQASD